MGLAGLWETWSDATGGEIDTACIITTGANQLMSNVHERMPAILPREAFSLWLDTDGVDPAAAIELLTRAPETALELVPIGPPGRSIRQRRRDGAGGVGGNGAGGAMNYSGKPQRVGLRAAS